VTRPGFHGDSHRQHPLGSDPTPLTRVTYAVKIYPDDVFEDPIPPMPIVNGIWSHAIPPSLDDWYVVGFWGYHNRPDNGIDTVLRLTRENVPGGSNSITSSPHLVIPASEQAPYEYTLPVPIDDTQNQIASATQKLRVDVIDCDPDLVWNVGVEITLSPANYLLTVP
jgi:hypothetical protein